MLEDSTPHDLQRIKALIRATPNFPKPGILFQDIFPIFEDPQAVRCLVNHIVHHIHASPVHAGLGVDVVVGLDARGFLLGPWIAAELGAAFVPVRKRGKLPGACVDVSYALEYGTDAFQMQEGAIAPGKRVLILDDLIATGGSAKAAQDLIHLQQGVVVECIFIIELMGLGGRAKLSAPVYSLVQFAD
jgi:adenine phosphoribosyltransferase